MKDGCRCKVDVTRRHFDRYKEILIDALRLKSTVAKHTNVMMHMLGYFKKDLTGDEKQEMLEIIQAYRGELVPLVVPLNLFFHYVRKYDQPYLILTQRL